MNPFESRKVPLEPSKSGRSLVVDSSCIDCLDRTNVVQSAIARRVLTEMLTQLGIVPSLSDVENVFNDGTQICLELSDVSLGQQWGHLELVLRPHLGVEGRLRQNR